VRKLIPILAAFIKGQTSLAAERKNARRENLMKIGPYRVTIRLGALIVPGLCIGYGIYQYLTVRQLPDSDINLVLIEPVFLLMIIFTLWVLAQSTEIQREEAIEEPQADSPPKKAKKGFLLRSPEARKLGSFVLLFGLYVSLIQPLGFVLCNMLFLGGCMFLLGVRRWHLLLIIPAVATAAVYLLFQLWMQAPIPEGILEILP
jgi:hypothetical protein